MDHLRLSISSLQGQWHSLGHYSPYGKLCLPKNRERNIKGRLDDRLSHCHHIWRDRLTIPHNLFINASYADDVVSLHSHIKGFVTWIGYTWFSADYICIVHQPSRNLLVATLTLFLSLPLMIILWKNKIYGKVRPSFAYWQLSL